MTLGSVIPMLRIFDEDKAKEFYIDYLGFEIEFEHRFEDGFPLYMGIVRDGCVLHLTEHHGDSCPGSAIRVAADDIDSFHKELTAKDYAFYKPEVVDTPFGTRDMLVIDPFGNRLTFSGEGET